MRVGIIADTHDNIESVERAVELFEREDVATVLHCGDVIAPPVLPFFDGCELHLVLGNNDGEVRGLERTLADMDPPGTLHGRFAIVELDNKRVAMMHGEDLKEVNAVAQSGVTDVVCYGHHHETRNTTIGETKVLNPGGHFPTVAPDRRQVAILDTETESIRLHAVA